MENYFWTFLLFLSVSGLPCQTIAGNNSDTQYTVKEMEGLGKLKIAIADIIYEDYQSLNSYLIHFLRKKKLNINETAKLLEENFNWRKENGIDSILEEEEMIKLEKHLPFHVDSVDKEGRPTLIASLQKFNLRTVTIAGKGDMHFRYQIYVQEKLLHHLHKLALGGNDVSQVNFLINFAGFNLHQHTCLQCLQQSPQTSHVINSYYPKLTHEVIFINAPRAFTTLLEMHKKILLPTDEKHLYVYGFDKTEWRKHLEERFDDDQLPPEFGGTRHQSSKPKALLIKNSQ